MTKTVAERLLEKGISLPIVGVPTANYVPTKVIGSVIYVSGQIPRLNGEVRHVGKVGATISLEEARDAARICALSVVAQLKLALDGDLERVRNCIRLRGFVNAVPDYDRHAEVIDAASDIFVDVFGERGRHVRTAMGAGSLPRNVSVEIDAEFEITP
ncbi:RidA family protein [Pseudomonas sp. GX19020]|uniref:RidA family protein n=1 Tax=Pseudomonas sp. GX19020 TaxID=2942277 RepID=UPI002019FDF3|nr:RidA family protein [Pseudomonas sp. GX19020]MCL4068090.1 RidA family protein [Pseudomonas sp. GX19020]